MKELTKHEVCLLLSAICVEGLDNTQWTETKVFATTNAQQVFGTDDNAVILEPGWYVAVYSEEDDDFPMLQRLLCDIITDSEKCVLLDTNVLIFCIEKYGTC
jgi:hypothetical protein